MPGGAEEAVQRNPIVLSWAARQMASPGGEQRIRKMMWIDTGAIESGKPKEHANRTILLATIKEGES